MLQKYEIMIEIINTKSRTVILKGTTDYNKM